VGVVGGGGGGEGGFKGVFWVLIFEGWVFFLFF